jgi:diadenosine tetraphosphate (Ap4A) HIT family hydrolase
MIMLQTLEEAHAAGIAPWSLEQIEWQDFHIVVFRDKYPVTKGHLLFVPRQNTPGLIHEAFTSALHEGNRLVDEGLCDAYNVGINMGEAAGQTVMYPHVHLIPRRVGDSADPVGGVRGVILGQANYKKTGYQTPV